MLRIKYAFLLFFGVLFQKVCAQTVEIQGKIVSDLNVENINVINKTAQVFTISDVNGIFTITAKLNDTLQFSSVQHKPKMVIIDDIVIRFKALRVDLEEQINELDEVLVGKVLSGNLLLDINTTEGKPPINFYDVGIPGYTGKIATQSERRLSEASNLNPTAGGSMNGAGGSISLNPIINAISGRTKMLKNRVKIEEKEAVMRSIKGRLANDFFMSNPLDEDLKMDFFYFCADDENFIKHCKNQTDFKILIFLRMKYRQYQENLENNQD